MALIELQQKDGQWIKITHKSGDTIWVWVRSDKKDDSHGHVQIVVDIEPGEFLVNASPGTNPPSETRAVPKATPWIPLTPTQLQLVDGHFDAAVKYSRWICERHWDADECESRACGALMRAARNYDDDRGVTFRLFLRQTIRQEMLSWRSSLSRKASRRPPHENIELIEVAEAAAVGDAEFADTKARLYRHLNPRQCEIMDLRIDGLTYDEIAERMMLTRETVNGAMGRARRILQRVA